MRRRSPSILFLAAAMAAPWAALHAGESGAALRSELFMSSDADGSEVSRIGLGWDWRRRDREHWSGALIEHARFAGSGWSANERRLYLRAAGTLGEGEPEDRTWRWRIAPGTNGDTLLGSAALHTEGARRRELFIEREVLETREGVARGQVHTFLGGAIDVPLAEHAGATVLLGLQEFGDGNLRTHLRGNLVQAVVPEAGLSVQLRTRWFRNSDPFAGDYFSPPWYAEALAVAAMRRVMGGHAWRVAAGQGGQRQQGTGTRTARMLQVGYESPRWRASSLRIDAGYSQTPAAAASGDGRYSYRYLMLQGVVAF